MKYIIIAFIGYALGYDDSKDVYTSFYKAILNKINGYEKERTANVE
jgi:hypothetical protein